VVEENVEVLLGDAVGDRHASAVPPYEIVALDAGELLRIGGDEIGDGGVGGERRRGSEERI
jgi:hypothetical protein